MAAWGVIARPAKSGDVSGLEVVITDGEDEHTVGHVAFVRPLATQPDIPFEDALQAVLDRAEEALVTVSELQEAFDAELDQAALTVDETITAFRDRMDKTLGELRGKVRRAMADALSEAVQPT